MSVPNTDNFSMQDVVDEIGAGDDLVELFGLANPDGFDPLYNPGLENSNLLNFRNYNNNPYQTIPFGPKAFDIADGWILEDGATISGGVLTLPVNSLASITFNQESNLPVQLSWPTSPGGLGTLVADYGISSALLVAPPTPWFPPVQPVGPILVTFGAKDDIVILNQFELIYNEAVATILPPLAGDTFSTNHIRVNGGTWVDYPNTITFLPDDEIEYEIIGSSGQTNWQINAINESDDSVISSNNNGAGMSTFIIPSAAPAWLGGNIDFQGESV